MNNKQHSWPHARVSVPKKPDLEDDIVIVCPAPFGIGVGVSVSLGFSKSGSVPSNALMKDGQPVTVTGLYILVM